MRRSARGLISAASFWIAKLSPRCFAYWRVLIEHHAAERRPALKWPTPARKMASSRPNDYRTART